MSDLDHTSENHTPINRELGYSEHNWCRAVASGTGVTVLALHLSNQTPESLNLHEILNVIRESHPLLACKLHYASSSKTFTFRQCDRVLVLRVHSAVCDRPTAVSLLRELMEAVADGGTGGVKRLLKNDGEGEMSVESLIQSGLKKKRMWAHRILMMWNDDVAWCALGVGCGWSALYHFRKGFDL